MMSAWAIGLQRPRQGGRMGRHQRDTVNAAVVRLFMGTDLGFTQYGAAVDQFRAQVDIGGGYRHHPAGDGQHLAHADDSLFKRAVNAVERGQEQVAERLPLISTFRKPVVEQTAQRWLSIGQGTDAVADIAGAAACQGRSAARPNRRRHPPW